MFASQYSSLTSVDYSLVSASIKVKIVGVLSCSHSDPSGQPVFND